MDQTTIYALASGRGPAGIAVIRISGPAAMTAAKKLTGAALPARRIRRVTFYQEDIDDVLDQGLAVYFPAPASFTGEDVIEFHIHGGNAVIDGMLNALSRVGSLRMALPGEFSRRGFENGKIDLTAAEGLADLVSAETDAQRRMALRQMGGKLAGFVEGCRSRLVTAIASWEALIDFSDEELPSDLEETVTCVVKALIEEIERALSDGSLGERLRQGFEIVILGPPNVGKSTLLNRLASREVAIVSAHAGTTRDIVEAQMDIGGFPVILADTAGLRPASEYVEEEGIRRARVRGAGAFLKIVVLDSKTWVDFDLMPLEVSHSNTIIVLNKADLPMRDVPRMLVGCEPLRISARTGEGVGALIEEIKRALVLGGTHGDAPVITRARHREALEGALCSLRRFLGATDRRGHPELGAEDLRMAARSLGRVTGGVDVEDILDAIFSEFCIGK
ncbi:MAG: tRNA uridine-5-carboxymethylaminomethyl(34) synthesis GTPase MnmE [Rhodospirillaceae bacterium TMED8]|nr:tRNA uridine-5-carboxymethylaminomethyl(34) synthesis GTPase MnmE [Magnetovibrio sp.]OUT50378.1 MAG: tRNA uridine-5-carboxymethylaminomethyl(34) synthesis GTPase MnmE [Rhodospirillaceae bacterium TMED8]|tara:strand:+ start:1929 stop:3272 length:1344 start_codon:yes stop_codon:yes gene_type:complete